MTHVDFRRIAEIAGELEECAFGLGEAPPTRYDVASAYIRQAHGYRLALVEELLDGDLRPTAALSARAAADALAKRL